MAKECIKVKENEKNYDIKINGRCILKYYEKNLKRNNLDFKKVNINDKLNEFTECLYEKENKIVANTKCFDKVMNKRINELSKKQKRNKLLK